MSYDPTKTLKTDAQGKTIPQVWNPVINDFDAMTGHDGGIDVYSVGDIITVAPVTGAKVVTTTAAEMFAGTTPLTNRYSMSVKNTGTTSAYWGGSSAVTVDNGYELLPGNAVAFKFKPDIAVPIYFISSASTNVRVVELA